MKNGSILIVNGSPRMQGNTRNILKTLESSFLEEPGNKVEFIDICRHTLKGCVNCDSCRKNGGKCVHDDDTNLLMEKVLSSDVILFGSPVYWMGVTAQLKLLIDKFYCKDPVMHGLKKKIAIISVGAAELSDGQYGIIEAQFREMAEFLEWEFVFSKSFAAWNEGDWGKDPEEVKEVKRLRELF
ncbi:MAG: flavodoxin family protein [Lentisphaeria bacterium]|nr:flavodoxin family protein [Lentisphaeria bacterium]